MRDEDDDKIQHYFRIYIHLDIVLKHQAKPNCAYSSSQFLYGVDMH